MSTDGVAAALAALTGALLTWRWRRRGSEWAWVDRVGVVLLVPGVLVFARLVVRLVVGALAVDWNGCRLAPTVALTRGYRLYYPATDGPVLDTIYGPVAALAYLPVALFDSPTPMILLGAALNLAFVVGPLLLFTLRASGRGAAAERRAVAAWLGVCLLMTSMAGPYYWLSMTHADGPALALGLLACLVLTVRPGEPAPGPSRLVVSALLATLATWTKQTSLPVGIALAVFVGWAYGRRAALRYAVSLLLLGLATSAVLVPLFGFESMWFNLVTVPGRQPWYFPGVAGLLHVGGWFAKASQPVLALLVVAALARLVQRRTAYPGAVHPALVAILPALFLIPTGLLGASKFGGNENSFHSLYFVMASALAWLVAEGPGAPRVIARACAYGLCIVGAVVAWRWGYADLRGPAPRVFPNPHQQAYEFARAHPGTAYFPWHPLATLLAEGQLRHFAYGVLDRTLGGSPLTLEHFRAYLPPQMTYVVVRDQDRKVMGYLAEYTEKRTSDELPGWTLLTRPDAGSASPASPRTSGDRRYLATVGQHHRRRRDPARPQ
jgi:hypothetical protein